MFIKKFKLTSRFAEENEFETTKIRKTVTTMSHSVITDNEGNLLSATGISVPEVKTHITEEVTAISLPSRTPAHVELLEIINDEDPNSPQEQNPETPQKNQNGPKIMQGPVRQKPITLDQLQGGRGIAKPMRVNFDPETTMWVN